MKTMLSCVVLAALVALVSADGDCNLPLKIGEKLDDKFCELLKTTTAACINSTNPDFKALAEHIAPGEGKERTAITQEQKEAMQKSCKAMQECVEPIVQGEAVYQSIIAACELISFATDEAKKACAATYVMNGCHNMHPFGGHHGPNGAQPAAEAAGFMAPKNKIMSMFF